MYCIRFVVLRKEHIIDDPGYVSMIPAGAVNCHLIQAGVTPRDELDLEMCVG